MRVCLHEAQRPMRSGSWSLCSIGKEDGVSEAFGEAIKSPRKGQ